MEADKNLTSVEQDFYKDLVNQSRDLILVLDEEGHFRFVSGSVRTLMGYEPEELLGTFVLDLVYPEDKPELEAILYNRQINLPDKIIDFRYKVKSGELLWFGAVASNQFRNPAINGLLINVRNVTERKKLQFDFFQRKLRFKALFENTPDAVIYESPDGLIVDANQAFLQYSGLPKEKVTGQSFISFLQPEVAPVCRRYFEETLRGSPVRFDLELKTSDGTVKIFDTIKFPVMANGEITGVYTIAKDMTPIVEAYETIQRQAKKLNNIFESITDAFFTLDTGLHFTYLNKEFGKVMQVDPEMLIGTHIRDFFSNELAEEFLDKYYSVNETRQAVHFEAFYRQLNIWLAVKAFPSDEGVSVYFTDITRQKRIELQEALGKKVLEQNAWPDSRLEDLVTMYLVELEKLYPGMYCSVLTLNNNRLYIFAAPSLPEAFLANINGIEIGPVAGSCGTAAFLKQKVVVHDIAIDPLWKDYKTLAGRFGLKACWSLPIVGSNQEVLATFAIYYKTEKLPTPEEEDAVEKARNLLRLIMENKMAAEALKASTERFRLATSATADVIYDWNLATNAVFWADSLLDLFGIQAQELVYSLEFWKKYTHPDDVKWVLDSVQNAFNDPDVLYWQDEYRVIRANGKLIYVIDKGHIIRNENRKAIRMVGAIHDITHRKRAELEREHLIAELQQRNKSLQQFTHIVSHNLRAPVARMLGLATVFSMPQADAATKEMVLKGIQESARNLDTVIKDLSQILTVRESLDQIKEPLWLEEETQAVVKLIREDLEQFKIDLHTDFSGAPVVVTVKSYLQSILYNLLSNAIKYRIPERKTLIEVASRPEDGYIVLQVKDNGSGIDLEKQKGKLFGLYKRFHADIDGKGLGLYLVKSQAEALGGKVEVQSEVNKGTTFEIYFRES